LPSIGQQLHKVVIIRRNLVKLTQHIETLVVYQTNS
jgi:hypothetical protein